MSDERDPRRRFNTSERVALFLAADGRCANADCGNPLEPGWHGDHVTPHSRGGPTDVINGQALCPRCDLLKGASMPGTLPKLRACQEDALQQYIAENQRDWIACLTPGAGKTILAYAIAERLLQDGTIDQVLVVVPTDALRSQWADNSPRSVPLQPVTDIDPPLERKQPYKGLIVTYQQLAGPAALLVRRYCAQRPTLAIIDEIHHAGDNKRWGDGLRAACDPAARRLGLTGTLYRSDNNPIPFTEYAASGKIRADFAYEYGEAVRDEVCRVIVCHAFTAEARWVDLGKIIAANVDDTLSDDDAGAALEALYDPRNQWIPSMLGSVAAHLADLRREVPAAAGCIFCERQRWAEDYADLLARVTGQRPTVVISDDPDANRKLEAFKRSTDPWIIAVRKISEGVDIPRLAVGLYASKYRTPLHFRQVIGRLVRKQPGDEHTATLFLPADPKLKRFAKEVEDELRHELELERQQSERALREIDPQQTLNLRVPLSASPAEFDRTIRRGEEFSTEMQTAEAECRRYGIPAIHAHALAAMFRDRQVQQPDEPVQSPEPAVEPIHRYEKRLRQEIDRLAGQLAYQRGGPAYKAEVNRELYQRQGHRPRSRLPVAELEQLRDWIAAELQ